MDLCISMHRAVWTKSYRHLAVVLSVNGLSLVFCLLCLHLEADFMEADLMEADLIEADLMEVNRISFQWPEGSLG